ncbi:Cation transporter [Penicillium angulare]|uniref:Cation transporter n=1 Tax=Penicillium angulare TaxID=116970 RepID=UPI002541A219|nr:Cation transporter [Penicillium angulare]KAJ5279856.1 Cation transporter [Penicillium angulare]
MWGAFELASIQDQEIRSLSGGNRALDGLFQSLLSAAIGYGLYLILSKKDPDEQQKHETFRKTSSRYL